MLALLAMLCVIGAFFCGKSIGQICHDKDLGLPTMIIWSLANGIVWGLLYNWLKVYV